MCLLIYSAKLVPPLRINIDEGRRKLLEVSAETSVMDPGAFNWANAAGGVGGGAKCARENSLLYIPLL